MERVWPLMHSWLTSPLLLEEKHRWKLLIASTFFSPFSAFCLCSSSGYQDQVYLKIGYRFSLNFLAWGEGGGYRKSSVAVPSWYGLGTQERVFSWRDANTKHLVSCLQFFPVFDDRRKEAWVFSMQKKVWGNSSKEVFDGIRLSSFSYFWKYLHAGLHFQTKLVATLTQTAKFPCKPPKPRDWSKACIGHLGRKAQIHLCCFWRDDSLRTTRKQADENSGQDLSMPTLLYIHFARN